MKGDNTLSAVAQHWVHEALVFFKISDDIPVYVLTES